MNTHTETNRYSSRIASMRPSCIREMMNVTSCKDVISFGGGLPNPRLFPIASMSEAAARVFQSDGSSVLQYSSSEGYLPLRTYVAEHLLRKRGIEASPDQILITNGSQQALDLIAKIFINPGDIIVMEAPTYLSAIQAFGMFEPKFMTCNMRTNGLDTGQLSTYLSDYPVKLIYAVPNFQNPTGLSYSLATRIETARLISNHPGILVEDDPYHELRFNEEIHPLITTMLPKDQAILTGTFSKVLAPGMRMGWIYTTPEIIQKLLIAKQASDLCSSMLTQRILYEYLSSNELEQHIRQLRQTYCRQRDVMWESIQTFFPTTVHCTMPQGGMFLWGTLPDHWHAAEILMETIKAGVVFAPGSSFFADQVKHNTMRLNFTHADEQQIRHGIEIIGFIMKTLYE